MRVEEVTLWVCDQCGYYRSDESTGRHQTANSADPRGPMVGHELKPARFVRAAEEATTLVERLRGTRESAE